VEQHGRVGQATYVNVTIRHIRFACWINKTRHTHTQTHTLFHCNNGCTNAPQCYVILTLPVLLYLSTDIVIACVVEKPTTISVRSV